MQTFCNKCLFFLIVPENSVNVSFPSKEFTRYFQLEFCLQDLDSVTHLMRDALKIPVYKERTIIGGS